MTAFVSAMRQMFARPRAPVGNMPFDSGADDEPTADSRDAGDSLPMIYRSEAFAEDLYDSLPA